MVFGWFRAGLEFSCGVLGDSECLWSHLGSYWVRPGGVFGGFGILSFRCLRKCLSEEDAAGLSCYHLLRGLGLIFEIFKICLAGAHLVKIFLYDWGDYNLF